MGAKRKVDEKLYKKIKQELKTPKDDPKAIKKYKLSQTTIRAIRKSTSYTQFLVRTSGKKLATEKRNFKVNPKALKKSKKKRLLFKDLTPQERTQLAWQGFLWISIISILIVAGIIVRWIFGLIFGG